MVMQEILDKAAAQKALSDAEVLALLSARESGDLEQIFQTARALRSQYFDNKVFYYGFVYFSTHCKNNCSFCYFRQENHGLKRYRKTKEEILQTALALKDSGVHLIDLTMGEDPYFLNQEEELFDLIQTVKTKTQLPVMVSPGVVSDGFIKRLAEAGVEWYALYQETHNRDLFAKLRLDQDYDQRYQAKVLAKNCGMLIEEGLLVGIGECTEDLVHSMREMGSLSASQVRTMTFIPQEQTPLANQKTNEATQELLNIAVMRILYPHCLIPASLDVEGRAGLAERLQAGANVITSIIPPEEGLAGVAHAECDIDEGNRTIASIQEIIKDCGLEGADVADYTRWIAKRKQDLRP
ncbi:methylornithine synthase PylB [Bengtsoniella intestinalis]|uniref:methylornithine synthase PylB n=1 Tax=Bengtsoniella intestinalis TaxID=3073143 RepID=UPI00391F7F79